MRPIAGVLRTPLDGKAFYLELSDAEAARTDHLARIHFLLAPPWLAVYGLRRTGLRVNRSQWDSHWPQHPKVTSEISAWFRDAKRITVIIRRKNFEYIKFICEINRIWRYWSLNSYCLFQLWASNWNNWRHTFFNFLNETINLLAL